MKYSYKYTIHAVAMAILYTNVFITIYLFFVEFIRENKEFRKPSWTISEKE